MIRIALFALAFGVGLLCVEVMVVAAPPGANFPEPTPIRDANPAVREPLTILVPTQLAVTRTPQTLTVAVKGDDATLKKVKIDVGSKMMTGVQCELFIYAQGTPRPDQPSEISLTGGADFKSVAAGASTLNLKTDGIPAPGKTYIVEMVLSLFETEIPPQHEWAPASGKKYKVIWTRTLTEVSAPLENASKSH